VDKAKYHIFVCASFRAEGESKGACFKKGSTSLLPYIENEILDRGLDAQVTSTGCLKACEYGPVMVVHPPGSWYGPIENEAAVDQVLDAIEDNREASDYLIR